MGQSLPLEAKAFSALVALLRACREQEHGSADPDVDTETLPDVESFPLNYTGVLTHLACFVAAYLLCIYTIVMQKHSQ